MQNLKSNESLNLDAIVASVTGKACIEEKLEEIRSLPELNRARIAQFCYHRVHLRELGLRIAATCKLSSLKIAFGANAQFVKIQADNADELVANWNKNRTSLPNFLMPV